MEGMMRGQNRGTMRSGTEALWHFVNTDAGVPLNHLCQNGQGRSMRHL